MFFCILKGSSCPEGGKKRQNYFSEQNKYNARQKQQHVDKKKDKSC